MGVVMRWLGAVLVALAVFFGGWGGLAAGAVFDTATEIGIAGAVSTVVLTILGARATRGRSSAPRVGPRAPADRPRYAGRAVERPASVPVQTGRRSAPPGYSGPLPVEREPRERESRGDGAGEYDKDESRPRYLTGLLPERAPAGARIALLAQVTLTAPRRPSAAMEAFPVSRSGTTVTITVSAPGLVPVGDLEQDLTVPPGTDSRPVRFGFIAGPPGLHVVEVRAFTGGTCLGELALQVSVEPGAALEEGRPRAALMAGLAAEPGEVTLQVSRTVKGGYSFQLLSEALYPMVLIDRLAGDPATAVGQMVAELRAMSKGIADY